MSKTETQAETKETEGEAAESSTPENPPREYGGPKGKEPTRYGDWEKNGRCIDF